MKKLKIFILKPSSIELILIWILLLIISCFNFLQSCQLYSVPSIDNQILTTWKFTALNGNIPYRDIFYPYGILFYFKHTNMFFSIISILLTPLLFLSIFIVLRKIWVKRLVVYLIFIAFIAFVFLYPGIEVFNRYGILLCLSLFLAYIFWRRAYVSKQLIFSIGILLGIIFSLIQDQGIYGLGLVIFLLFLNPVIRQGIEELRKMRYYQGFYIRILLHLVGFCVGFSPYALSLLNQEMFLQFISYIQKLPDFSVYGKTPFIPYSATMDNIFIYIPLIIGLFYVLSKTLFEKNKFTFNYYLILLLIMIIIMLEQKSIIRSISTQITFISFFLLLILGKEFDNHLVNMRITGRERVIFYVAFFVTVFTVKLQLNYTSYSQFIKPEEIFSSKNLNGTLHNAFKACLSYDINMQTSAYSAFNDVVSSIKQDSNKPIIFDYFSYPIFYIVFQQSPPYYVTSYEGTPLYAQIANIEYIKTERVEYIIYNLHLDSVSDGVPGYARSSALFKYVINNFTFYDQKGEFIILKKNNRDIFGTISQKDNVFIDHLLNINLAAIPRSEGYYKFYDLYKEGEIIVSGKSEEEINKYLKKNSLKSSSKFLVIIPEEYKNQEKEMTVTLQAENKLSTKVNFQRCSIGKPCIINISNLPIFYKVRVLKSIDIDEAFKGKIEVVESKSEKLW